MIDFEVEAVDHPGGRPPEHRRVRLHPQPDTRSTPDAAATATTRGTSSSTCRPGSIADPHASPQCDDADFAANTLPDRAPRSVLIRIGFDNETPPVQPLFPIPVYNLDDPSGTGGPVRLSRPADHQLPVFTIASARTEGDYGLEPDHDGHHPRPRRSGSASSKRKSGGSRRTPANDLERLGPQGCEPTHTGRVNRLRRRFPSTSPPRAYLNNPTTCGEPLIAGLDVQWYDHYRESTSTSPFPATDRAATSSAFNPSLSAARPRPRPTPPRASTSISRSPRATSPSVPLLVLDPRRRRDAAGRVLDQPQRRRRQDRLHRRGGAFRHRATSPRTARSPRRSAPCRSTARALPGPIPGFVYLGEPQARRTATG